MGKHLVYHSTLISHPEIMVDENGLIKEAKFKVYTCESAVDSCSLMTEMILGKSVSIKPVFLVVHGVSHLNLSRSRVLTNQVDYALSVKSRDIDQALGRPPMHFAVQRGCSRM